ncbi:cupin domain-containing protein [Streptomyces sp. NPDC035033]|uniref:cupin domain-containing protein n=1 Tax=Streptomyces sp. NPDC035033 TaxID=3155368 RepID=UPI0033F05D59
MSGDTYTTHVETEATAIGINFGSMLLSVEPGGRTEGHAHESAEVWVTDAGAGYVELPDGRLEMRPGTPVEIPARSFHTVHCTSEEPLVFLALWWKRVTP